VVVGASMPLFGAATRASALSAGGAWAGAGREGWGGWQPDLRLGSPEDVIAAGDGAAAMRPLAEVMVEGELPRLHWGSLIEVSDGVFAAGRYFSSTDRRLAQHKLSGVIVASKASPGAAALLGEIRDQRRMANQGRFRVTQELAGERVVLIDGVLASGAVTRACTRELLGAGASEVWTLVAGVSQDAFQRECPRCGEGMMQRVFGKFGPLYVCTKRRCKYTERWDG
jgi:hypothetical protein